jgi:hypothetical protein
MLRATAGASSYPPPKRNPKPWRSALLVSCGFETDPFTSGTPSVPSVDTELGYRIRAAQAQ